MGWIFAVVLFVWLLSRCNSKKVERNKDEFSGDSVGSLFLLENVVDDPDHGGLRDKEYHSEEGYHSEEWFDDDR